MRVRALGALGVRTANPVGGRGTRRRLVAAVACHAVTRVAGTRICTCRGAHRDACHARVRHYGRCGLAGFVLAIGTALT